MQRSVGPGFVERGIGSGLVERGAGSGLVVAGPSPGFLLQHHRLVRQPNILILISSLKLFLS